jgi:hypothetical protein
VDYPHVYVSNYGADDGRAIYIDTWPIEENAFGFTRVVEDATAWSSMSKPSSRTTGSRDVTVFSNLLIGCKEILRSSSPNREGHKPLAARLPMGFILCDAVK